MLQLNGNAPENLSEIFLVLYNFLDEGLIREKMQKLLYKRLECFLSI